MKAHHRAPAIAKRLTPAGLKGDFEIQYFVGGYGDAWWKSVIAQFKEKNPDLNIKESAGPKINVQMKPRWLQGDPPDVIYIDGAGSNARQQIVDDQLLDLTDWIKEAANVDGEKIVDQMIGQPDMFDGKVYTLPLCSNSGSDNGGPWIGNYRFPDMHKLAGEMEQIGVRPGIWFRPLLAHYNIPDSWKRYTQNGHFLDPSVSDVLAYISETIKQMTAWGYQLIKHDFSTFDLLGQWGFQMGSNVTTLPYTFADRSRTTAEIIGQFYQTIADASGDSLIIGCNTIGHLAAGRFEIQRTGDDTSGRDWERTRRMGINTLAFRMPQHGTFFSHDADCVGLTNDVPWELNRQWMDLLSASGTPLFVSASPTDTSKEQQKHIRLAFERASKSSPVAEPLDWLDTTSPSRWRIRDQEVEYDWTDYSLTAHSPSEKFWWK
ncbi:hypothetical protein [Cohnella silvisoli]|uniref:Uncharacterized protein n=1 Tax=Cohnella silvisoli TaxID=2873699 RepID=A0ABV1KLX2_9BACL|nr:hypothetical protein [Cohnella silvisoli]MCD9020617.1 hypothetical protein [Cohnella silvisoli]